jgi:methyl-accepting chemotaxis protein
MTRLESVRHIAQIVLVSSFAAFVPIYFIATIFVVPDKSIIGSIIAAVAAGLTFLAWRAAPQEASTRITIGLAAMIFPAMLVYALSGTSWQIDAHMTFFAVLAATAALCDWRAVVAAAGVAAVHHLTLNFVFPSAVFPDGSDFFRVVFHAVVVVAQTGVLVWMTATFARTLE